MDISKLVNSIVKDNDEALSLKYVDSVEIGFL